MLLCMCVCDIFFEDSDPELRNKQPKMCHHCGQEPKKPKRCPGCDNVYYCDKKCQSNHWNHGHKSICEVTGSRYK